MTAPQELRTSRLLLRSFENEDIPALVRLAGAREIAATTVQIPHPYTENDARTFLAKAAEDFQAGLSVAFAVSLPAGRELCGAMGLHLSDAHQRAELGYWIGVPFGGRGFATEAARAVVEFGFQTLHLRRIHAHHFAENTGSGRVLKKIGMAHEGRSRQHVMKWGQFIDVENYGLLAEEFAAGQQARLGEGPAERRGE